MATRWGAVFVCQGGAIEFKAAVLAASMRAHSGRDVRLVAAVPGPDTLWQRPSKATLDYLESIDVRVTATVNPIGTHYPIGNKFGALAVMPDVDRCLVLDSDIMSLAPISDLAIRSPVAAKPEDRPGPWADGREWRRLYRWAEVDGWSPNDRITTTVSGHQMPPYFNAGVVALDPSSGFAEHWLHWARRIDSREQMRHRYPWLDQISLPLAARDVDVVPQHLDVTWNWPAHHWRLPRPVTFAHYHEPAVIEEDPLLLGALHQLVQQDDRLSEVLEQDDAWTRTMNRSTVVDRSTLIVVGARPGQSLQDGLMKLRQQGFRTVKADPQWVRRVHADPDASGVATWLRRFWLADNADREPLVLWDESTLVRDLDRLARAIDGFTLAEWSDYPQNRRWPGLPWGSRVRRHSSVVRLSLNDLESAASFSRWRDIATIGRPERIELGEAAL